MCLRRLNALAWRARACTLGRLGNFYLRRGDFEAARRWLAAAAAAAERAFGSDDERVVQALNRLGVACKYAGAFDDADRSYAHALRIAYARACPPLPIIADLYHNVGGVAHARADYAAGVGPAVAGLLLRTRLRGPDHPQVAADRAALGALLDGLGQLDLAEALLVTALSVFERHLGPDHPEVASVLNNLGALHFRRGDLAAAEHELRRSLRIKEKTVGRKHPQLVTVTQNLAEVLNARVSHAAALS